MKNCPLRRLSKGAQRFCWRVRVFGLFNEYGVGGTIVSSPAHETIPSDLAVRYRERCRIACRSIESTAMVPRPEVENPMLDREHENLVGATRVEFAVSCHPPPAETSSFARNSLNK
jgi:hypothetical protein